MSQTWRFHRARKRWLAWRLYHRDPSDNCFYCGVRFESSGSRQRSMDHVIPRSMGGKNWLSNLRWACVKCNGRKGNQSAISFLYSPWLEQRRATIAKENQLPRSG